MSNIAIYDDFEIKQSTRSFIEQYATSRYCPDQWKLIDKSGKRQFPNDETRLAEMEIAYVYGRSLGLNLFSSLKYIAVINGQPCAWGDALVALVQSSGELTGFSEWIEGEKDNRIAYCRMQRKNGTDITKSFSVQNAKDAGLWNNVKKQVWKQYPDIMLAARARGFCIRAVFADILQGLITKEEAEDYPEQQNNNLSFSPAPTPEISISDTEEVQDAEIIDEGMNIPETENNASTPSENASDDDVNFTEFRREKVQGLLNRTLEQFQGQSLETIEERTMSEKYQSWITDFTQEFPDLVKTYQEKLSSLIDKKIKEKK